MAVIQNKIATRTWSKNEYGDAALTYSTGNDCLVWDCLNQTSSDNNISPTSKTNGAIPESKTPPIISAKKCVTQGFVDSIYTPYNINVTKTLTIYTNSEFNKKHVLVKAYYLNPGEGTAVIASPTDSPASSSAPSSSIAPPILLLNNGYVNQNINITVTIIYSKYETQTLPGGNITDWYEKARTSFNAVMGTSATAGLKTGVLLNHTISPNIDNTVITGTLDYATFFNAYFDDMYAYYNYNAHQFNEKFETMVTLDTYYSLPLNSEKEVQKYIPCNEPFQTIEDTSNSSIPPATATTSTYATFFYNCTSGPNSGPGTWTFTAFAYDLYPSYDTTMEFKAFVDNGVLEYTSSYNTNENKMTMTGTITSPLSGVIPKITLRYGTKNTTTTSNYIEKYFAASMRYYENPSVVQ